MGDLLETFGQWFGAASSYDMSDFREFITAVLRSMGYNGEDWVGFSSMAGVTDWLVGLFGPLATLYEFLISSIDSATFIKIVNWLLGLTAR